MKTISVVWHDGFLIASCDDDETLNSDTVEWSEPITAASDSHAIAQAITAHQDVMLYAVEHDGERVFVHVR